MPAATPTLSPAETVRLQYLASARSGMELWRSVVAEDVEWTESAGFPLAGTYRTPDGTIDAVFAELAEEWAGSPTTTPTSPMANDRVEAA